MKLLIAIVGPTGIGKSSLGISIAQKFNCEIINADSRQIYKLMDIGTAKPSQEDYKLIRHHLYDIINPDESYSVALYKRAAANIIDDIQKRQKIPLLIGGSGQYIWSVIENWSIPAIAPDMDFRKELEERAKIGGIDQLFDELNQIDPEAASRINQNNLRRIIRALEIYSKTGEKPSKIVSKSGLPYPVLIIGMTGNRKHIYERIDMRIDKMIEIGFIEEVKKLLGLGYSIDLSSFSSVGYKQIGMFLANSLTLEEAVSRTKFKTHRVARAQYTWFQADDTRIKWFDYEDSINEKVYDEIDQYIETAPKAGYSNQLF